MQRGLTCVVALGLTVATVGCGADAGPDLVAGSGDPPGQVSATVTVLGTNVDAEPEPRGTVILAGSPPRYAWLQAISSEDYALLRSEATSSSAASASRSIAPGLTMRAYAVGDTFRLLTSDESVDPAEIVPHLLDPSSMPAGLEFVPVSVAATVGTQFDLAEDPVETLPEGAAIVAVTIGGVELSGVTFEAEPGATVGLLMNERTLVAPNTWTGEVDAGQDVLLLEDPTRDRVVVLHGVEDLDRVVGSRSALLDRVADAVATSQEKGS